MKRFNFYHIIGLFAMGVCLSGCIYDKTIDWNHKETEANLYTLQLAVTTQTEVTRAAGHEDEYGTEAENYIDFAGEDYRVLLFNADGTYKATILPNRLTYKPGSNNTHFVEGLITEAEKPSGKFYVVVVANWKAYDGSNYDTNFNDFNTSTDDLWQNGTGFNFNYQRTAGNSSTIWTPDNANPKRLIPMFGMTQVEEESFSAPDQNGNSYITATIPMLRALAKVEVVDEITTGNSTNTEFKNVLNSVSLSRYNTTGRLIPNVNENPSWGVQDIQVTKASLPEGEASPKGTILPFLRIVNNNNKTTWMAYIPEMALGEWKSDNRPRLLLNVSSSYNYQQSKAPSIDMFHKWDSYEKDARPSGSLEGFNFECNLNQSKSFNQLIFGPWITKSDGGRSETVNGSIYVDLTDCEQIQLSGSTTGNLPIRILYNRPSLEDGGDEAKAIFISFAPTRSTINLNIHLSDPPARIIERNNNTYDVYVAEPYFHVNSIKTAKNENGYTGTTTVNDIAFIFDESMELTADYQVDFCNYSNGIPTNAEGYDYILRNHIYRFNVRMNAQLSGLQVDYTVCPWEVKSTEITFK